MFTLGNIPDIEDVATDDALECLGAELQNLLDLGVHVKTTTPEPSHSKRRKQDETHDSEPPRGSPELEVKSPTNSYGNEGHPEIALENMNSRQAITENMDYNEITGRDAPGGPSRDQTQPESGPQTIVLSTRAAIYLDLAREISKLVDAAGGRKKTATSRLQPPDLTRTSSTTSLSTLLTARGDNDEPTYIQNQKLSIAKRFFLKTPPPVSITDYLHRIHKYCPLSTSTFIAAGHYIYKVCVKHHSVPFVAENAHRLILAALRVACKVIEDLTYPQKRFSVAGGVSPADLFKLEIAFLFLIDFDIKIDAIVLNRELEKMAIIQKARDTIDVPTE